MKPWLAAIAFAAALVAFAPTAFGSHAAVAAATPSPPSASVTLMGSALSFTAPDLSNPAATSAPITLTGSVVFTTSAGGGGTVKVNSVNLSTLPSGSTLDQRNFTLTCKRTSGNTGFVASAPAALSAGGSTTCGTLSANKSNVTSNFTIQLTLNDTATATVPFTAATYTAQFSITATAS